MARSRTWNLRLNLDEFNSVCSGISDDHDLAEILRGFIRGINSRLLPEQASPLHGEGFSIGKDARDDAENFRLAQQARGRMGGNPNLSKSQPPVNHRLTTAQPPVNQWDNPTDKPNHNPLSFNPLNQKPQTDGSPSDSCQNPGGFDYDDGLDAELIISTEKKKTKISKEPTPADRIIATWNEATKGKLPEARSTPKRANLIRIRTEEPEWEREFNAACSFVASNSWYLGENDRKWVATIDFLLQAGRATEIAEKANAPKFPSTKGSVDATSQFNNRRTAE